MSIRCLTAPVVIFLLAAAAAGCSETQGRGTIVGQPTSTQAALPTSLPTNTPTTTHATTVPSTVAIGFAPTVTYHLRLKSENGTAREDATLYLGSPGESSTYTDQLITACGAKLTQYDVVVPYTLQIVDRTPGKSIRIGLSYQLTNDRHSYDNGTRAYLDTTPPACDDVTLADGMDLSLSATTLGVASTNEFSEGGSIASHGLIVLLDGANSRNEDPKSLRGLFFAVFGTSNGDPIQFWVYQVDGGVYGYDQRLSEGTYVVVYIPLDGKSDPCKADLVVCTH